MAMDFWNAQARAKMRSRLYILAFILMTLAVALLIDFLVGWMTDSPSDAPIFGAAFAGITFVSAGYHYLMVRSQGGSYIAESIGAEQLSTHSPVGQMVQNIVEEIAIAASLPVPKVFVMQADEINAFAAGFTPDQSAITVTTGAIKKLSRDELQGVIAHEYGHIKNGDMKMSVQVAVMVAGFFLVLYIGLRMMDAARYQRYNDERRSNPVGMAALILIAAGSFTYFFGTILKSLLSQEREYLADASAVQYTRNPAGLIGALKKISLDYRVQDMPKAGAPYSHLYFNNYSLFATHPPIERRIAALEGRD